MNELKCLDFNEIKKVKIDIELAKQKNLIKDNNYGKYIQVQALYKKVFDYYLEKSMPFNIDDMLKESKLDYGKLKENEKTSYHKWSNLKSKYLYVRNFLFIERLEEADLQFFLQRINANNFEVDEIVENIVKSSFKKIIKYFPNKDNEKLKICYDWSTPDFAFDNNALAIYLNYGRNTIELTEEEFFENKIRKEGYLSQILGLFSIILQDRINCKVETRWYKGTI